MSFPIETIPGTVVGEHGRKGAWELEGQDLEHILGIPWGSDPASISSSIKWAHERGAGLRDHPIPEPLSVQMSQYPRESIVLIV